MMKVKNKKLIFLLGLLIVWFFPNSNTLGAPYVIEVIHKGQKVNVEFGMSRWKIEEHFGAPIKERVSETFRPVGIRRSWDYTDVSFSFDKDRLYEIDLHSSKSGDQINVRGYDPYQLNEPIAIGDSFEKVDRVLQAYEKKLRTEYNMIDREVYEDSEDSKTSDEEPEVYSIRLKLEAAYPHGWAQVGKVHGGPRFEYSFEFGKDNKVKGIRVVNNYYTSLFMPDIFSP